MCHLNFIEKRLCFITSKLRHLKFEILKLHLHIQQPEKLHSPQLRLSVLVQQPDPTEQNSSIKLTQMEASPLTKSQGIERPIIQILFPLLSAFSRRPNSNLCREKFTVRHQQKELRNSTETTTVLSADPTAATNLNRMIPIEIKKKLQTLIQKAQKKKEEEKTLAIRQIQFQKHT